NCGAAAAHAGRERTGFADRRRVQHADSARRDRRAAATTNEAADRHDGYADVTVEQAKTTIAALSLHDANVAPAGGGSAACESLVRGEAGLRREIALNE